MRKSAVATDVASPLTRAAAALHRPTGTPVQLMRRLVPLDAEHDAAPLTPRAASAARRLVRGAFFLPQDSQQRKKMMLDLEKWLKELKASRSLRIHIKEMQEADAHHQRALAEQEKEEQHKRRERMILRLVAPMGGSPRVTDSSLPDTPRRRDLCVPLFSNLSLIHI